jgi:hypothetical protein
VARHQKQGKKHNKDAQTFENESIIGSPKVAKKQRDLVGPNIYKSRSISKDIELVRLPQIFGRLNFDSALVFLL